MRVFLDALIFLMFANDGGAVYSHFTFAPFSWVDPVFFDPLPLVKVRPFDLCFLVGLVAAGRKGARVKPMRDVLLLAMATTVLWLLIGLSRGGDGRAAGHQIYMMLAMPVTAFALAATHPTVESFRPLMKVILAAAFFRALMCLVFYFGYVRNVPGMDWQFMTDHDDTVLWVIAIMILVVNFFDSRTVWTRVGLFLGFPFIVAAIHFNNRRLAWVSLAGALGAFYFLVPPSALKRRMNRFAIFLAPLLLVYVVVGWGRSGTIFKPIAAISQVSETSDSSSKARNVENLSLIATASYNNFTGSGWGHKYIELSNKYSIAEASELWPYIPHNSILGLFAYTGYLGVMGYWMIFPTAVFFLARTSRLGSTQAARSLGMLGVIMIVVCLSQWFGDMGIFARRAMYSLSIIFAMALRIPIEAGVWGARRSVAAPSASPTNDTPSTEG